MAQQAQAQQAPMRPMQRSDQRTPQRFVPRNSMNRFELDESRIPPNMSYEWKCKTIMGQENIEGLINYEANRWTSVPPERHPELTGSRASQMREIVRAGLVLMERPKEITAIVKDQEEFEARNQVSTQLQRLRLTGARAAGRGISTSYSPGNEQSVPEDN
jgi:hypothetical protein